MNAPEITPDQRRFLQHLEGIAARQFAHELLLEAQYSILLGSLQAPGRDAVLRRLTEAARLRFGPGAVVPSTNDSAAITARTSALALFNVEAFVAKMAAGFPGSPAPAPSREA